MTGSEDRIALVLVDLQNDFCHPDGVFAASGRRVEKLGELIEATNRLVREARKAGHLIVWIKMVWDGEDDLGLISSRSPFLAETGLRRGTWGAELLDGLDVAPGDTVVEKKRFSGFFKTDLESTLRAAGIGKLTVGGVRTDFCVESTVRDGYFRDFDITVVADACAGYSADMHEASLRVLNTVFSRVVKLDQALAEMSRT